MINDVNLNEKCEFKPPPPAYSIELPTYSEAIEFYKNHKPEDNDDDQPPNYYNHSRQTFYLKQVL
jgi:hypothetical protein